MQMRIPIGKLNILINLNIKLYNSPIKRILNNAKMTISIILFRVQTENSTFFMR